ncbi:hypothetical protein [Chitinolyticbacter meiyuanensis]|uniref:hypothetical protein n=1 Tax=Chitinolyticbacter meiyuanensis TaxID=682798 RepID=UPI0011E5DB6D|nr:hypothetical protein [Chitinolyticbacter meiyuanensis]
MSDKFNFSLKFLEPTPRGLVMEIQLVLDGDFPVRSAFVDEEAFGFLEEAIRREWPSYTKYGHWGTTVISTDAWGKIMSSWKKLSFDLMQTDSVAEIDCIGFLFDDSKEHFEQEFTSARRGLVSLIEALVNWSAPEQGSIKEVVIRGV